VATHVDARGGFNDVSRAHVLAAVIQLAPHAAQFVFAATVAVPCSVSGPPRRRARSVSLRRRRYRRPRRGHARKLSLGCEHRRRAVDDAPTRRVFGTARLPGEPRGSRGTASAAGRRPPAAGHGLVRLIVQDSDARTGTDCASAPHRVTIRDFESATAAEGPALKSASCSPAARLRWLRRTVCRPFAGEGAWWTSRPRRVGAPCGHGRTSSAPSPSLFTAPVRPAGRVSSGDARSAGGPH
jgi:hypothetical protein